MILPIDIQCDIPTNHIIQQIMLNYIRYQFQSTQWWLHHDYIEQWEECETKLNKGEKKKR